MLRIEGLSEDELVEHALTFIGAGTIPPPPSPPSLTFFRSLAFLYFPFIFFSLSQVTKRQRQALPLSSIFSPLTQTA